MTYRICWKDEKGDIQQTTEVIEGMREALDYCHYLLSLYGCYHWIEEV